MATKTFTREEVAKHNTVDSCYFVYANGVYDVTKFLSSVSSLKVYNKKNMFLLFFGYFVWYVVTTHVLFSPLFPFLSFCPFPPHFTYLIISNTNALFLSLIAPWRHGGCLGVCRYVNMCEIEKSPPNETHQTQTTLMDRETNRDNRINIRTQIDIETSA